MLALHHCPESPQGPRDPTARPCGVSSASVAAQPTLSSTSTTEVTIVCLEDSTSDPKIQTGIQVGFDGQRQRTGATAGGRASDAAKVRILDSRLEGRREE